MNIINYILTIIAFYALAELITWLARKETTYWFIYSMLIRSLVILFSIFAIKCIAEDKSTTKNVKHNLELIQHQDSLITYQNDMIIELFNHLWYQHDCDLPQFDGQLKDKIDYEKFILDSLYNNTSIN